MKEEILLAQRAIELAMLISKQTNISATYHYQSNVNYVGAYFSRKRPKIEFTSIITSEPANKKNLQYIVDCFEFMYAVAERKANA